MAIEPRAREALTAAEVQANIDAAAEGDVIHLGPGRIKGCLVIDKSITLRGAGAETPSWASILCGLLILGTLLAVRLYRLEDVPTEVHGDSAQKVVKRYEAHSPVCRY